MVVFVEARDIRLVDVIPQQLILASLRSEANDWPTSRPTSRMTS
jgi:hypothetical protein